jgi:hypothetical protein
MTQEIDKFQPKKETIQEPDIPQPDGSKFLWPDKGIEVSGFMSESWGSNQSWVAQLEAQEKHLPD